MCCPYRCCKQYMMLQVPGVNYFKTQIKPIWDNSRSTGLPQCQIGRADLTIQTKLMDLVSRGYVCGGLEASCCTCGKKRPPLCFRRRWGIWCMDAVLPIRGGSLNSENLFLKLHFLQRGLIASKFHNIIVPNITCASAFLLYKNSRSQRQCHIIEGGPVGPLENDNIYGNSCRQKPNVDESSGMYSISTIVSMLTCPPRRS